MSEAGKLLDSSKIANYSPRSGWNKSLNQARVLQNIVELDDSALLASGFFMAWQSHCSPTAARALGLWLCLLTIQERRARCSIDKRYNFETHLRITTTKNKARSKEAPSDQDGFSPHQGGAYYLHLVNANVGSRPLKLQLDFTATL